MTRAPPVLLITFRRPDTTRQVLDALRPLAPAKMYVASDGARSGSPADAAGVAATRALLEEAIDWRCDVQTLFSEDNHGCRFGPMRAMDWFFEHEREGVVLEDDCVPHADFLPFCAELLERYRDDERVMVVSGRNPCPRPNVGGPDFLFSNFPQTWGWATWRRAWRLNLVDPARLLAPALQRDMRARLAALPGLVDHFSDRWREIVHEGLDAWDYTWTGSIWASSGVCIQPARNLIRNVGFAEGATHTVRGGDWVDASGLGVDPADVVGPPTVLADIGHDRDLARRVFSLPAARPSRRRRAARRLRRLIASVRS